MRSIAEGSGRFQKNEAHPQPISAAEYWTYLSAAALLAVLYLSPRLRGGETSRAKTGPGAFGTFRSVDEPRAVQHLRADEYGRGRNATAPWYIPARGWKDILWRTYRQTSEDRLLAVAAGVVFYGLLALFPAITAVVSLYGLFANPRQSMTTLRLRREFCLRRAWTSSMNRLSGLQRRAIPNWGLPSFPG